MEIFASSSKFHQNAFNSPSKRFPLTTITVELTLSKLLRQRLISRLNKIEHDQISFFLRARVQVNHDHCWLRDWQFFWSVAKSFLITASDLSDRRLQCLQQDSAACSKKCVNQLQTPRASHKWDVPLSLKSYHLFKKVHMLINGIMRWRMSHEYQMHFITHCWQ